MPDKPTTEELDEIVERVARAITETWSSHFGDGVPYDELPQMTQACRLAEARAALTAIARTHALVPREASEEMVRAAFGWREKDSREGLTGEVDMFHRALSRGIEEGDLLASLREGG